MRVQADHWEIILQFCEKNPQVITNKFNGINGRTESVELWKQLCLKLNSLGYGEKTLEGWKKTIIDWKSKTKAKAGQINLYKNKTGGGKPINLILSSYEERLLAIMGRTCYEGDTTVSEKGLGKRMDDNNIQMKKISTEIAPIHTLPSTSTETVLCETITADCMNIIDPSYDHTYTKEINILPRPHVSHIPDTSNSSYVEIVKTPQKKHNIHPESTDNTPRQNSTLKRKRQKQNSDNLEKMHNDLMTVLTDMQQNMSIIAKSLQSIASSLKK